MNEQERSIVLKTEPVIDYKDALAIVSADVKGRIQALNLETIEASEENLKLIKDTRASLNKEKDTLENQRKLIKQTLLKPYEEFEAEYKKLVLDPLSSAETLLKGKVDEVTNGIKAKFEADIMKEFEEFRIAYACPWLEFRQLGINILTSKTLKSYIDQMETAFNKIQEETKLIDTLPHKERIHAEYQVSLNATEAITRVNSQVKREEEIETRKQQEIARQAELKAQAVKEIEERPSLFTPPVEHHVPDSELPFPPKQESTDKNALGPSKPIVEETYEASFKCTGTLTQLKALKAYLLANGIKFESI